MGPQAKPSLIGARVQRTEDPRFLRGDTRYVGDLQLPGMASVAFLRSSTAHGRILSIEGIPEALALAGVHRVMTGDELAERCAPIVVPWETFLEYHACEQPPIAIDTVRFVGEILAAVVADDRYVAEDALELLYADIDPLPAVTDPLAAMEPGAPQLHANIPRNTNYRGHFANPAIERVIEGATHAVSMRVRMNRHTALPMEGLAVLAFYDPGTENLTLWSSTQMPHMVRSKLAEWLDYPENRIRVIAPDVGGGFGQKANVQPEELILAALSLDLRRPLKWVEDRQESLVSSYQAKEEVVDCTLAFDGSGKITGLKARFIGDGGAYSAYPWSPSAEPLMASATVQGPYVVPVADTEGVCVHTSKATCSVYRGVGQPAGTYAMEHTLDMAAHAMGIDPAELRRRNMIGADAFPYTTFLGGVYDSGQPIATMELALETIGYGAFRAEQAAQREAGRFIGIGQGSMMELTTFGYNEMKNIGWGQRVSAYETAQVTVDPSGGVTLRAGTQNHGQGHETTYAQLAASVLGCELDRVTVETGDTSASPYGWGTWGSRSAVAGGGAILHACEHVRDKAKRVAAHLLEASVQDIDYEAGVAFVRGTPDRALTLADIAQAAIVRGDVPDEEDPTLDEIHTYKPPSPYAQATHVAIVEVDIETGEVELLRYVVAEDCGQMINPTIVEGQIHGGVAQGIGGVLYEHLRYDDDGQFLTGSLMDYLVPTANEVPPIEIKHLVTRSPVSKGGIKGMGEGGAVAPLAAIANAVADALVPVCGWQPIDTLPITPEYVLRHIEANATDASDPNKEIS